MRTKMCLMVLEIGNLAFEKFLRSFGNILKVKVKQSLKVRGYVES